MSIFKSYEISSQVIDMANANMENYLEKLTLFEKPDFDKIEEPTSAVYFYDARAHPSTHEQLLNDRWTTDTFKGWIQNNSGLIKGKIVLDVGCGTGWLSILAAQAGAARVISVEWSHIAQYTKEIVKNNNYEHIITVIKGNIEDIKLPDGIEMVDVIVSQWIGQCLFHGGRIKKVILARDRWLKPNGVIIPDRASLFLAAISDEEFRENKIEFWNNVLGFDLSVIADETLRQAQFNSAFPPEKMVTNLCRVKKIDLRLQSYEHITSEAPFKLVAKRNDFIQGYCAFFTVQFSLDSKKRELDTNPRTDQTNWGQTCFYFRKYFKIKKKEHISGSFSMFGVNNDERFLGVHIGTYFEGQLDKLVDLRSFILRS